MPKPLKRNKNLQPLSHEHHQGLITALRLDKGVQNKTDPAIMREYVLGFWEEQLAAHFRREEELFTGHADNEHKLYIQFLNEHRDIRKQVDKLEQGKDVNLDSFRLFAEKLRAHIRFEERLFFPWLQETLSPDQLQEIGKGLEEIEETCYHFNPSFWEKTAG